MTKPVSFAGIAAWLLMVGNFGVFGEPIQFSKPAQKPDATQEKKNNILQYRAYRPSESISGAPNITDHAPIPAVPTPVTPPSRTSRQNQELLDRQKNWIFVSPEDEKKADSAEEVLGIDEFLLDDEKSKSVITKFLENRKSNDSKSGVNEKGSDKDQKKEFGAPQTFGLGNEKQNQDGNSLQRDSFEKNFNERGPRELSLPALWREQNGPRADKMRDEKQIRMNEFQSLFGSQSATPVGGEFNNFGLQPASPQSGGDAFSRDPGAYKAPEPFRGIPRPFAGSGVAAPSDINTRVFGQSAVRAPIPEPSRSVQQPAVLPVPKRRF